MADKTELRKHILKAYCAVNDAITVGQSSVEHGGKDIGLAALLMIARNALHWALDAVDYERKGRIASEPAGPHFPFRPATVWKPTDEPPEDPLQREPAPWLMAKAKANTARITNPKPSGEFWRKLAARFKRKPIKKGD